MFTREQKSKAYKKLPEKVQSFVTSPETTDLIARILKNNGVSEEQIVFADGEIFNSMIGLQNLDTAIQNIAKLSGRKAEELSKLKSSLGSEIFSKYKELGAVTEMPINTEPAKKQEPIVITHETKENALKELDRREEKADGLNKLNKEENTKAVEIPPQILPEVLPKEAVRDVKPQMPEPAKTVPLSQIKPEAPKQMPVPDYRYPKGKDPYREPIL